MTIPHALTGIYGLPARVYRRGEDQAVVLLGPTGASACIVHPWRWGNASYRDECEVLPEKVEAGIHQIFAHSTAVAHGRSTLGELLVWCSRRPKPQIVEPGDAHDDDCCSDTFEHWPEMDEQPIGVDSEQHVMAVNRWLVRECLQRLIADGAKAARKIEMDVCPLYSGHVLRMSSADVEIAVMSLRPDTGCGNDSMPGGWVRG